MSRLGYVLGCWIINVSMTVVVSLGVRVLLLTCHALCGMGSSSEDADKIL